MNSLLLVVLIMGADPTPSPEPPTACEAWLARIYALATSTCTEEVSRTAVTDHMAGNTLLLLRHGQTKAEKLWACKDCWSPIAVSPEAVVLLGPKGVYQVTADKKVELVYETEDVRELVAVLGKTEGKRLLVVMRGGSRAIRILDLGAKRAEPLPGAELAWERQATKPGQVRGGEILLATKPFGEAGPQKIVRRSRANGAVTLLPDEDDGVDQLDPTWLGDKGDVVYVEKR